MTFVALCVAVLFAGCATQAPVATLPIIQSLQSAEGSNLARLAEHVPRNLEQSKNESHSDGLRISKWTIHRVNKYSL